MSLLTDQAVDLLHRMGPTDLAQVRQHINAMSSLGAAIPKPEETTNDWVLEGFANYMVKHQLLSPSSPLFALRKREAYKQYIAKLPALMAFLKGVEAQLPTKTKHRPQLAYLIAGALADYLRERSYFSCSAMLSQIDKVPEALDLALPGYVGAGLIAFVLRE